MRDGNSKSNNNMRRKHGKVCSEMVWNDVVFGVFGVFCNRHN